MRECPTVNKLAPERKGLAYTCRRSIGYTRERASRIGLAVERTAEVLGRGGLALIPTETVYGVAVAVNAFSDAVPQDTSEFPSWPRDPQAAVNGAAVPALGTGYRRIFTLKQRGAHANRRLAGSMASKHSTAMAWISRKMPAYSRDDAGREP